MLLLRQTANLDHPVRIICLRYLISKNSGNRLQGVRVGVAQDEKSRMIERAPIRTSIHPKENLD